VTMLTHYDRAMTALSEALSSTRIDVVKDGLDYLDGVRDHAKRVRNRELLADATEFQMRVERWLGVLLQRATEAGQLLAKGDNRKKRKVEGDAPPPATLDEIGVDRKLSMRARASAEMLDEAFAEAIAGMRMRMASGKAIIVDDAARHGDKKVQRAVRERELAARQQALPDKRYGVIYADPEWRFEVYSRDTGMDRSADNHYPTSSTDAICARPVQDIAADDCVLFLWATVPMLPDALRVMAAWGFEYKSHAIWLKDKIGTGYWFRNQHELLLVGTRGNVPAPAMGTQFVSVNSAAVTAHSEKPASFYTMIESYFPNMPKIELNARIAREGWDRWGFEAPQEKAA
jgi:N6-adenosine-specific RNA methylase IME4